MQPYLQEELIKLRKRIIKMLMLVNSQLEKSSQSVLNSDFETADVALKNEIHIDKLDLKIDKLCQRIFALAQPVATDLRFIMSSLRIASEIERIGDIAIDIIDRSESVRVYQESLTEFEIPQLLSGVIRNGQQTAEAYMNTNNELANAIVSSCHKTAEMCKSIFNEIIGKMTKKSQVTAIATDLVLIVRDLERITNHMENIAESIVFIVEGKRIRHITGS